MERMATTHRDETKPLLRVLAGEALTPPPIWLMRQAGRYLPEYRAVRAKAGSFQKLCYTPELAAEVTLQPVTRFGFDAAILFADILLVPEALGLDLTFVDGEGPRLSWPGGTVDAVALAAPEAVDERLSPVFATVGMVRRDLPRGVALIGFAGAPWTVATYMIAGRGTADLGPARRMMFADPERFDALIDRLVVATVRYLARQIEAGADAVMLFDSWAGVLTPAMFERYAVRPVERIIRALREFRPKVPVIGFPRGAGMMLGGFAAATGVDAVGIDWQTPLARARAAMPGAALQGNLDPMLTVVGGRAMTDGARRIVEEMHGHPHVFNLGHGITPEADPAHVEALVRAVRA